MGGAGGRAGSGYEKENQKGFQLEVSSFTAGEGQPLTHVRQVIGKSAPDLLSQHGV